MIYFIIPILCFVFYISSCSDKKEEFGDTDTTAPTLAEEPAVTKPFATTEDATYTIQVFASRKHENAKKLVEKLKANGFEDAFIFKHTAGSKTLYRVRVGKVARSETKKLADKLKNLKYIESVQVTRF